jgi:hypothetical protein
VKNFDAFKALIEYRLRSADAALHAFRVKFDEAPAHALEWSLGAFDAAGERVVCKAVLRMMESGDTSTAIAARVRREALQGARAGSRSTSPASNLMEQCTTSAWAHVALEMDGAE